MRRNKRLERDPIKSALFELRFEPSFDGLPEVLPGMLYRALGGAFPVVNPLPQSEIPAGIRQNMPNWQFMALRQMSSRDGKCNLNIAHSAVNIELIGGYPGWGVFRAHIGSVIGAIAELEVVKRFTRYSLRYQNILKPEVLPEISDLRMELKLADSAVSMTGLQIRAELHADEFISIVNLGSDVTFAVTTQGKVHEDKGALVDIDVIPSQMDGNFLSRREELIDKLHDREKEVFFGILSESVIDRLGPVWED